MNIFRSKQLTVTCILALIYSSIALILSFATLLSLQTITDSLELALQSIGDNYLYEGLPIYIENLKNYGFLLYSLYLICSAVSIFAVYMIWNKRKAGLYVYSCVIFLPQLTSFIIHMHSSNLILSIIGIQLLISFAFFLAFLFSAKELI